MITFKKKQNAMNPRFFLLWALIPVLGGGLYPYLKLNPQHLDWLVTALTLYTLFFSIVVHELFHGLAANFCGDPSAKNAGRLTFNPFKHVSPIGSILVPLVLHLSSASVVFGWAKPVPFNPINLRQHPRDQVFLAVAGPLSNFSLAYLFFTLNLIAGTCFHVFYPKVELTLGNDIFSPLQMPAVPFEAFWFILFTILTLGMVLNIFLGTFNLIPFPPLDGSWLLKALLPPKLTVYFGRIQQFGFLLFIAALHFRLLDIFFYPAIMIIWTLLAIVENTLR